MKFLLRLKEFSFRHAYPLLLISWIIVFGMESFKLARWSTAFWRVTGRLENTATALRQNAKESQSLCDQIRAQSGELDFLNQLPNILPQDQSFVRTQRAIAEEVAELRRKVGQKLKGNLHILVDSKANKLYVKKGLKLLWQADCSVGRGGTLSDPKTGQRWVFSTPRGEFRIVWKEENPIWVKPDWAYVETKEPIPPPEDPIRKTPGELGAYVLSLGDGYLIHGTKNTESLGRPASHGCVRLGADDLKKLYENVPLGTKVYIY